MNNRIYVCSGLELPVHVMVHGHWKNKPNNTFLFIHLMGSFCFQVFVIRKADYRPSWLHLGNWISPTFLSSPCLLRTYSRQIRWRILFETFGLNLPALSWNIQKFRPMWTKENRKLQSKWWLSPVCDTFSSFRYCPVVPIRDENKILITLCKYWEKSFLGGFTAISLHRMSSCQIRHLLLLWQCSCSCFILCMYSQSYTVVFYCRLHRVNGILISFAREKIS